MSRYALFVVASAGLAVSPFVFAQSSPAEENNLDQIIVTGTRSPISVNVLGNATTVIDRMEIERLEARYVSDLLRKVPGFAVSQSGGFGSQTQVRVRGAEANHVLVLIDGVRANDPATGDEFRWEYLTTGNIDRIEIVRGPQSALWGSDAVAAVVHVVTNRNVSESSFSVYAESGSHATGNIGLKGSTGSDHWSLNGGFEYLDTGGISVSRTGDEKDGSNIATMSLGGRLQATEALTFDVGVRVADSLSEYDPIDFFMTGLPIDGDYIQEADNLYADISTMLKRSNSRYAHRLSVRQFISDNRNLVEGIEESSTAASRTSLMYQSDITLGVHRLSLALEHETTDFEQRGPIVFGDPNQDQDVNVTSFVADFGANLSEQLTVLLSARFDDNSDFDNATTGRVSVAYLLSDSMKLRANVGTGQKNPTFIERFGFFPGQFIGNPALHPERSTSYEVGADQEFGDGTLTLGITLFQQDLTDEINGFIFDPVTFLSTAENIAANSERDGVEIAASWRATERFEMAANYTYTDATEQDLAGQDIRELRRPRHSGSLSADYLSSDERFRTSLSASYDGTRSDIFFPPFPQQAETVALHNYWLLNLTFHYRATDTITVFARGANLLDEDYEQVYGYQTPGITGYIGIRASFGTGSR